MRPNLTFNYGLRWEVEMPFYEKFNQIQTLVPGEQSQVYPGAPTGLVFPLDTGIPITFANALEQFLSSPRPCLFACQGTAAFSAGCLVIQAKPASVWGPDGSFRQWKASPRA